MEKSQLNQIVKDIQFIKDFGFIRFAPANDEPYDADLLIKSFITFCVKWKARLLQLERDEQYELCKQVIEVVNLQCDFISEIAHLFNFPSVPEIIKEIKKQIIQMENYNQYLAANK